MKKKWSKGRVRDTLNNMVLFDQATYDKLYKEVVTYKLVSNVPCSHLVELRSITQSMAAGNFRVICEVCPDCLISSEVL